jgi:uncharacterized membrane protein YtjA (UPF0391 family)
MLYNAVIFLILALVAAAFGFLGIAGSATPLAQGLFVLFVCLALGSLLMKPRGPQRR